MSTNISSLTKKEDFKSLLKGKKKSNKYLTIFFKKIAGKNNRKLNISFVTKKKIGNAVKRNKMRRRLKMATRKAILEIQKKFKKKFKYAIFAKSKIYDENYQNIVNELATKLKLI